MSCDWHILLKYDREDMAVLKSSILASLKNHIKEFNCNLVTLSLFLNFFFILTGFTAEGVRDSDCPTQRTGTPVWQFSSKYFVTHKYVSLG
jgi:hypothetical protein